MWLRPPVAKTNALPPCRRRLPQPASSPVRLSDRAVCTQSISWRQGSAATAEVTAAIHLGAAGHNQKETCFVETRLLPSSCIMHGHHSREASGGQLGVDPGGSIVYIPRYPCTVNSVGLTDRGDLQPLRSIGRNGCQHAAGERQSLLGWVLFRGGTVQSVRYKNGFGVATRNHYVLNQRASKIYSRLETHTSGVDTQYIPSPRSIVRSGILL